MRSKLPPANFPHPVCFPPVSGLSQAPQPTSGRSAKCHFESFVQLRFRRDLRAEAGPPSPRGGSSSGGSIASSRKLQSLSTDFITHTYVMDTKPLDMYQPLHDVFADILKIGRGVRLLQVVLESTQKKLGRRATLCVSNF